MANTTTSIVTFSILSPDASLSYDRIKLRLEEYRTLLESDSDTVELSTENGKTVICRKQAKEMEEFLDQAETLLQDVVQSRDLSTIVVLHHLRDLSEVLDSLKLYDECYLTGNCALALAEALGRRSLEFRNEQAETLALIAGLSVYQPRSRTLFIQAVSICEEVVANDASHSNKMTLLDVLFEAGYRASDNLCVQWLGHAVQLMTKELPPTMVDPHLRSAIYYNYGNGLHLLGQYASAVEAHNKAISIRRMLVNDDPVRHNLYLAEARMNMGLALDDLGKCGDAIAAYKEVLEVCTAMAAHDPLEYNELTAKTLVNYGVIFKKSNQYSEAAAVEKQAVSLYRNLAQKSNERTELLCGALRNHGTTCYMLGSLAESVLAYQECILLLRALAATDSQERLLIKALHDIAISFLALEKHAEADAAANEAVEMNHGRGLETCQNALDFKLCFVCQRATIPDSLPNVSTPILPANSSSRPAERPGASIAPAETPNPTGETTNVSVHKRRKKILGFFRRNRAQ